MLGQKYQVSENETLTKEKILLESARLFAIHGYDAVSVKDIAEVVGIKAGSIYNHYISKEDVLNQVLDRFEKIYDEYYSRLTRANDKAETLQEVIDNLFHETREVVNMFNFYGMTIVIKEQFNVPRAKEILYNRLLGKDKEYLKTCFDHMVRLGKCAPVNTDTVAILITSAVLMAAFLAIQKVDRDETGDNFDLDQIYGDLGSFLLQIMDPAQKHAS